MLTHVDAFNKDVNFDNFEQKIDIWVIQSLSFVSDEARNTYGISLPRLKIAKLGYEESCVSHRVAKIISLKSIWSVLTIFAFLFTNLMTRQAVKSFARTLPALVVWIISKMQLNVCFLLSISRNSSFLDHEDLKR